MSYIKLEDLQKIPIRIDHYDEENGNINFVLGIETAIEYAESLPEADVVEVVRCKDCTFSNYSNYFGGLICDCGHGLIDVVKEDYFCSYGERNIK